MELHDSMMELCASTGIAFDDLFVVVFWLSFAFFGGIGYFFSLALDVVEIIVNRCIKPLFRKLIAKKNKPRN